MVQDIIPATRLTICKPSSLWPPPPNDVNQQVHELPRNSAQNVRGKAIVPPDNEDANRVGETPVTRPEDRETMVRVTSEDGTPVEIRNQIKLYTTNDLLIHPLVSPALAYLGGLPPLFFRCECARDAQGRDRIHVSLLRIGYKDVHIDGLRQGTSRCKSGEIPYVRCREEAVPGT